MPKVAIGVPVFNEARYIKHTIASLKAQDATDVCFQISDNCSTDDTYDLATREIAGDSRFSLHRHERNLGAGANFEFSLRAADSKYFMWVGGHDAISPNTVTRLVAALERDPSISIAMAKPHHMDEEGEDLGVNNGAVYDFAGTPIERFMASVQQLHDCTMFHSMFRLDVMQALGLRPIYGTDLIFISTLLWYGDAYFDETCAYFRRMFSKQQRSTTVIERIVGVAGATEDRHVFADAYRERLALLNARDPRLSSQIEEVTRILVGRFGPVCAPPAPPKLPPSFIGRLLGRLRR